MTKEDWYKLSSDRTYENLQLYSRRYDSGELNFNDIKQEISFLYNMGLYYSELFEENDPIQVIFRKKDKYYSAIYHYLKAIKIYEDNKEILKTDTGFLYETIRRLFVNIANEFSNQFRSINALDYYRKALEIDAFFDMAIGNFALGIEHHSPLLGLDEDKYSFVFNLIYELYFDLDLDNLDSGREFFNNKKIQYRDTQISLISSQVWCKNVKYNPYVFFNEIVTENDCYDNWCVFNTLYLNFINDLGCFEEAKFDIDVCKLNEELGLTEERLYVLDYLFELFKLQRKKIYECKSLNSRETLLELAQVFQCMYSYFDKIAFFIYKYFGLVGNEKLDINSIWTMKDKDNHPLLEYKNQYLYNIYWLRKEYKETAQDRLKINQLLSPDAQEYANIRNTLEHREFSFTRIDGLSYIDPKQLYSKSVKLANVVRNMLLSVLQMVRLEKKLLDPETNKRNFDLMYFEFEGFQIN